jgi:hypothetical protein
MALVGRRWRGYWAWYFDSVQQQQQQRCSGTGIDYDLNGSLIGRSQQLA